MRQVFMNAPGDVSVGERDDPKIIDPTDAVIRLSATCICGSDLWPYRGVEEVDHTPMGHEYVGVVEEIGSEVKTLKPGDFVVGSFVISDGTCEICRAGYPSRCVNAQFVAQSIGTQSEKARIPFADGTLVATAGQPDPELIPSLLAASDVLGTGWFAAVAAEVGPGTVAVVGDGAVGLMGVLSAEQLGAERIIAMSRHSDRQALAREFGATDIVAERGDAGVAKIKELTNGLGAHSVIEAVGTQESFQQAIGATRPGGHIGFVGVAHKGVSIPADELFFAEVHLHGGPAPVRRFLPDLIQLIWDRKINPGRVFNLTLPLDQAAEGYTAMDERRAIKVILSL